MNEARSTFRIVHSSISVKFWQAQPPSVDAVRPSHCVACGVAARKACGKLAIHGHGVRGRTVLGPAAIGAPPALSEVAARRFVCLRCGAVMLVVPAGVLRRRLYLGPAIALALGRWAEGKPAPVVRREVSPQASPGPTATVGWASLRRWAQAAPQLWPRSPPLARQPTWRATALAVVAFLASFAPLPSGRVTDDAVVGSGHFHRGPSRCGENSGLAHQP